MLTTPDPDRTADKDVIESRDAPVVFQENSEDSDDQDDGNLNQGYEMINQEDDVEDEVEEDEGQETSLADLVRAAQADPENLTEATREMMERARWDKVDILFTEVMNLLPSEAQRADQLAESARVWTNSEPRDDSIELNEEKIATIKSIMSGVKLKTVPNWTNDLNFDVLNEKTQTSEEKPS